MTPSIRKIIDAQIQILSEAETEWDLRFDFAYSSGLLSGLAVGGAITWEEQTEMSKIRSAIHAERLTVIFALEKVELVCEGNHE